ncbi:MAG: ATP-binding protein [Candidatus Omnitrophota bacterium]|jgi:GTPase SAR1 family protein
MNKSIFFDRKVYLDILQKRVSGLKDNYRQNIAIIGDELVGKTSLIFKFIDNFHDNRIILVYIDTRFESLSSFAKRFIGILLYNFLNNSGIILKEDLGFLIHKSSSYIPKTVEKINLILNNLAKKRTANIFSELMSLCENIHAETEKSCVVIFDEFQNLEGLGYKNLYRDWSRLLIANKNTMYMIISSMKFRAKEILSKDLSLLFGNFEVITVEPFDIKSSSEYLKLKLAGLNIVNPLRDFIVHFTGGYPMYLEVISEALLRNRGIDLAETLEDSLFSASGVLNQRFSNYMKRFSDHSAGNDYIAILYLISSGRNKIKDIAHILHKKKSELALRVSHLLGLDTITRSGDFLKINDRVFSFWIKFVYQEKLQALTFDAKNQKAKFRDQIETMIQEFMVSAQKPLMERMSELFKLFEDEMLQVEKKKIRLNHFREIKPLEFKSRMLKNGLIGRSNDSLWIIAVKAELISEEDIVEFSKECRKYRHKLQRKVIVTLNEIDTNTRLRALEEKIWAWDVNSLNQILDLYSRPRVIA